ncbi:type III restriction-modification system endonuclease [Halobacteriovorax sp. BALOs_7]|uniref:type III restriction-modification system endonuclease n=1 Tax=Halobacteriovorax sp. BALOs_7 TaxID=2109558 RepID=UPI000EA39435|nr:DEAD/DEAH box helicase family protein [Halobacteriovorax sp. BALOs_7]
MKIKFNPRLDYQIEAVESLVKIFEGQELCRANFSVPSVGGQMELGKNYNDIGVGNRLSLVDTEILENVRKVQLENGLPQAKDVNDIKSMNFSVEMETGTGKTYVYLRTIFELNKCYGFTKFIIVVPSIAIKEGVYKSLEITSDHFRNLYDNTSCDFFVYDSQKLNQVRSFATDDSIQVMIINIDAFRKSFTDPEKEDKANIFHRSREELSGAKPKELVQATSPILIIDEPQSVDATEKSKDAIESLNPLFTMRFSATHKEVYNLVYKLDAVDAYEKQLVKQIEVASVKIDDGNNRPYMCLKKVDYKKTPIIAKIEIDKREKSGDIKRKAVTVKDGKVNDLYELSGGRDIYEGYIVDHIHGVESKEYVSFTTKEDILEIGKPVGEVDKTEFQRLQIRKTIEEHLEKELRLKSKGIKILSLFFIDKVANYRSYDKDGNVLPGKFSIIFEEEFKAFAKKPRFKSLFNPKEVSVSELHDGYFATDKKNRVKDTKGNTQADEDAYNLIMKEKEKLLSFESKLKFIFSHSALREGWDNPNVFQICTLNETSSVMKKRQEIGRGLRLAVNQEGEREYGFETNTLTVVANESYEEFVFKLQKEIEEDSGIKFGLVETHVFSNIKMKDSVGKEVYVGAENSQKIWNFLKEKEYINEKGRAQDKLKLDLKDDKLEVPEEFKQQKSQIESVLKKITKGLSVKNAEARTAVELNKRAEIQDDFKQLWDKIKYKTRYRLDFDPQELITHCANEIKNTLVVPRTFAEVVKVKVDVGKGGVEAIDKREQKYVIEDKSFFLPDIVSYLQNETNLTRKTIVDILVKSERLDDFRKNPQRFIDEVQKIIKGRMRHFIVNGIKYHKIEGAEYYFQEVFESKELTGYLEKNLVKSQRSIYNYVVYDSDIEKKFVEQFESNDEVKVYAKLPHKFKIDTPLGGYNPDWAVLIEKNDESKLYFVVESKGTNVLDELRPSEKAKILCGEKHFEAIDSDAEFMVAKDYDDISKVVLSK